MVVSFMKRKRVVGYIAANNHSGRVVICVNISGQKLYFEADLNDVLEVLTSRRAWAHIYQR